MSSISVSYGGSASASASSSSSSSGSSSGSSSDSGSASAASATTTTTTTSSSATSRTRATAAALSLAPATRSAAPAPAFGAAARRSEEEEEKSGGVGNSALERGPNDPVPPYTVRPVQQPRTWGSALAAGPMAWNPLKARAPPREPPPPYSIGAVPAGYNPTAPASPANNGGGGATATSTATSTGGGTTQASAAAGNNGPNSPQIVWDADGNGVLDLRTASEKEADKLAEAAGTTTDDGTEFVITANEGGDGNDGQAPLVANSGTAATPTSYTPSYTYYNPAAERENGRWGLNCLACLVCICCLVPLALPMYFQLREAKGINEFFPGNDDTTQFYRDQFACSTYDELLDNAFRMLWSVFATAGVLCLCQCFCSGVAGILCKDITYKSRGCTKIWSLCNFVGAASFVLGGLSFVYFAWSTFRDIRNFDEDCMPPNAGGNPGITIEIGIGGSDGYDWSSEAEAVKDTFAFGITLFVMAILCLCCCCGFPSWYKKGTTE